MEIEWGPAAEALQTVWSVLPAREREHVLAEMRSWVEADPGDKVTPGQIALIEAVAASNHVQEGW